MIHKSIRYRRHARRREIRRRKKLTDNIVGNTEEWLSKIDIGKFAKTYRILSDVKRVEEEPRKGKWKHRLRDRREFERTSCQTD